MGGSVKVVYRTPLLLRKHLKPQKFEEYENPKSPMPNPKSVKKMEKLREKGLDVDYPRAPWYTDNVEELKKEEEAARKRMAEAHNAEYLENLPADRSPGVSLNKAKVQRPLFVRTIKYL
jgi:large subunit ribosomal protein L15